MSGDIPDVQFDPEVLDSLHDAIGDGINRIISVYVDDFPKNIQCMRSAMVQGDYETIGRLSHSLKSSSGNLGAYQLMALAAKLEKTIKTGSFQAIELEAMIVEIEAAFAQVLPWILGYVR